MGFRLSHRAAERLLRARYSTMLPAVLFMPASIAIPFIDSPTVALALICAITFFHQVWKTNLMTITNDLYPVASVGSVSGIVSLGSGLGGVVFMNIVGRIVEAFSYNGVFIIMGFLHPLAYLVCRLLVPPNTPGEIPVQTDAVSAAAARNLCCGGKAVRLLCHNFCWRFRNVVCFSEGMPAIHADRVTDGGGHLWATGTRHDLRNRDRYAGRHGTGSLGGDRNVGTNAMFRTATNESGFYTAPGLAVGEYQVSAEPPDSRRRCIAA